MSQIFKFGQRLRALRPHPPSIIAPFGLPSSERRRLLANATGDIELLFFSHKGRLIHKWVHYLPIYERHFAPFRGKPVKILEIGVSKGGSLELWRKYFGPDAIIFGIDVDPGCATVADPPTQVRIGSQADEGFLESVIAEMGRPDIIVDDGSHVAKHQLASFRALFPLLKDGGLYMIEDTHTAYWRPFGGGFGRKGTAIDLAKLIIDDMHAWYHDRKPVTPGKTEVEALHIYDSVIALEKGKRAPPQHIQVE